MHAHIVLAHPEPLSFNGHLATIARDSLEQQGWSVSTTDLYGKGFDPCSRETYAYNGRSGDIDLMLWPVNFSLAFVGYSVLTPFVAYGVESGIRYSDSDVIDKRLHTIAEQLAVRMNNIDDVPTIPFNRMSDWGEDGRIKHSAPVHSAFIRHREKLELE
jgi:NAD(P)H dehydrogenase (quinone)